MKMFWKLFVALTVVAAAGAGLYLWMREKKNALLAEDDLCTWNACDCDDCCCEESTEEESAE